MSPTTGFLSYGLTSFSAIQSGSIVPGTVLASIFTLQAKSASPVSVQSMTWTASGSVDETLFTRGVVVEDVNNNSVLETAELNVAVGQVNPAFAANDGRMTISYVTPLTIPANSARQFFLLLDGAGISPVTTALAGLTSGVSVAGASDIAATVSGSATTADGAFGSTQTVSLGIHDHLLISEVSWTPTAAEFVEIYNPTPYTVDMTNYHLTDVSHTGGTAGTTNFSYWELVNGGVAPATAFAPASTTTNTDWHARFPAGFKIRSGEVVVVALDGAGFAATVFTPPLPAGTQVLALRNVAVGQTALLVFRGNSAFDFVAANADGAAPVSYPSAGLTNGGEGLILYFWDGQAVPSSALVTDIDYVFYAGAAPSAINTRTNKSGISVNKTTAPAAVGTFMNETPGANVSTVGAANVTIVRKNFVETGETATGSNGFNGDDEMSEPPNNWSPALSAGPGRVQ